MIRILSYALSFILFVLSLFQECYAVNGQASIGSLGMMAFLLGLFNVSQSFFSWFANPLYFLTFFLILFQKKTALFTAVLAFVFALSFLFFNSVVINEAGITAEVEKYLLGYWLWLCCMALPVIGILIDKVISAKSRLT